MIVFDWYLSDKKFLHVSRILLSILTDLNNAVVWMMSTYPLTSKSSSHFTKSLGIVPSAPITNLHVPYFFLVIKQSLGAHIFFRFLLFLLSGPSGRQSQLFGSFSLFLLLLLLTINRSGRLAEIRKSV